MSFNLTAGGLVGDLVDLERQMVPTGPHDVGTFTQHGVHDGAVTASDEINLGALAVPPGGGVDIQYQLTFHTKLPSSALTLSVQVQSKRWPRRWRRSHGEFVRARTSRRSSLPVRPRRRRVLRPPRAPPRPPRANTAGPDATAPIAGGIGPGGGGGSLAWLAYTLGGLLLARRRRPDRHAARAARVAPSAGRPGSPALPRTGSYRADGSDRAVPGRPGSRGPIPDQTRVDPSAWRRPRPAGPATALDVTCPIAVQSKV